MEDVKIVCMNMKLNSNGKSFKRKQPEQSRIFLMNKNVFSNFRLYFNHLGSSRLIDTTVSNFKQHIKLTRINTFVQAKLVIKLIETIIKERSSSLKRKEK